MSKQSVAAGHVTVIQDIPNSVYYSSCRFTYPSLQWNDEVFELPVEMRWELPTAYYVAGYSKVPMPSYDLRLEPLEDSHYELEGIVDKMEEEGSWTSQPNSRMERPALPGVSASKSLVLSAQSSLDLTPLITHSSTFRDVSNLAKRSKEPMKELRRALESIYTTQMNNAVITQLDEAQIDYIIQDDDITESSTHQDNHGQDEKPLDHVGGGKQLAPTPLPSPAKRPSQADRRLPVIPKDEKIDILESDKPLKMPHGLRGLLRNSAGYLPHGLLPSREEGGRRICGSRGTTISGTPSTAGAMRTTRSRKRQVSYSKERYSRDADDSE